MKTYATAITLDTHPLELAEVKYLYGVNRVPSFPDYTPSSLEKQALPFNFTNQVTRPIQMLQEMDVDIFQPNAVDFFDLWVIQTLWAKFIGVASARVHERTGRTEIAAVSPRFYTYLPPRSLTEGVGPHALLDVQPLV